MDCVMKTIKRIQQLIIQSSGQNQTLTESILETDNLEQKLHLLIATGKLLNLVLPFFPSFLWLFIRNNVK